MTKIVRDFRDLVSSVWSLLWKVGIFCIALLLFATHWMADDLIFQDVPKSYSSGYQYLNLAADSSDAVAGRYLNNPASEYLLVYSHGNGEDLGRIEHVLKGFRQAGFSVMAYDYPGYGLSEGEPSEEGCYYALEAAIDFSVKRLGYSKDRMILYGRSLGSGPTLELASREEFAGVVLKGAFRSTFEVALGIGWIPWDRFQNHRKIDKIEEPILMIHGTEDDVVPFKHGRTLFEAVESPKLHYWVEGAGHNDVIAYLGAEYWRVIKDFARYLSA